jgi:dephospho-CoA kinase
MTTQPFLIGVSGKIGSGKNYLATKLTEEFTNRGYSCGETSFALPLKNQLSDIMEDRKGVNKLSIFALSKKYNISLWQMYRLVSFFKKDIKVDPNITGYNKTHGTRRAIQYLGTDIRRKQYDNYWIELLDKSLPQTDIVFVPDARFPNEANYIRNKQGFNLRLEVPREIILQRANDRDKIRYNSVSENHASETSLDNYTNFNRIVGATFDAVQLVDEIENRMRATQL